MPPNLPTAMPQPGANGMALLNALKARAIANTGAAPGGATAPNSMNGPIPQLGQPAAMAGRAGTNPAQAVMKAASQAQSPLVSDPEARNYAKQLIQKLMQHM